MLLLKKSGNFPFDMSTPLALRRHIWAAFRYLKQHVSFCSESYKLTRADYNWEGFKAQNMLAKLSDEVWYQIKKPLALSKLPSLRAGFLLCADLSAAGPLCVGQGGPVCHREFWSAFEPNS